MKAPEDGAAVRVFTCGMVPMIRFSTGTFDSNGALLCVSLRGEPHSRAVPFLSWETVHAENSFGVAP